MLEARNIIKLKLDRKSLAEHSALPAPRYAAKPLIGKFAAFNDTIVTTVAKVDMDTFKRQMDEARAHGTSLLCSDQNDNAVGVSAATSLIKSGDVMRKNLIVPQDMLRFDRDLAEHIVIGAFIRGSVEDGDLMCGDDVELAGWATAKDIQMLQSDTPPTFQSKLRVMALPCGLLRPMSTLLAKIETGELKPGCGKLKRRAVMYAGPVV